MFSFLLLLMYIKGFLLFFSSNTLWPRWALAFLVFFPQIWTAALSSPCEAWLCFWSWCIFFSCACSGRSYLCSHASLLPCLLDSWHSGIVCSWASRHTSVFWRASFQGTLPAISLSSLKFVPLKSGVATLLSSRYTKSFEFHFVTAVAEKVPTAISP